MAGGEQIPSARKPLELVRSPFGEAQARAGDEVGYDPRYQDFVRLRLRHDARGGMDGYAPDVMAPDLDFAGMKARAQRQSDLLRGRPERQGTAYGAARSIESRQNAVAGRLDQSPAMPLKQLNCQLIVTIQQSPPCLIAFRSSAPCRIDDVGEQNRGKNALEAIRRTVAMPGDELFDVAKQRVGIAAGEDVVAIGVFDEFGIRDQRCQLTASLNRHMNVGFSMKYQCWNPHRRENKSH